MHFLCPNKKEANKIKRLYLKEGKCIKIIKIKNNVFIDGILMKYEVSIDD